jgi:hypothetical protein
MQKANRPRTLVAALTEGEVMKLITKRTLLTERDVDTIVTESEIGLRPDGTILYILHKNVIPFDVCEAALPVALRAAKSPIIGGSRAIAAGAFTERTRRKDGTLSNRFGVPSMPHLKGAKAGLIGYYANSHCRETAFTAASWKQFNAFLPLTRAADAVFRHYLPTRHAAQAAAARLLDRRFVIPGSTFTTATVNKNFQTAVHTDRGDLRSGFGVLTCLAAGNFRGGQFVFPRYRVAIDFGTQDVLLADVHEPHGNLPIKGRGEFARLSIVLYFRELMLKKCPLKRIKK